ncbi:MAG: hypothetical protein PT116_18255 [Aphanizomenon gracile PMC638.10]|nr:hypothetical protein [Aphanizomenon gracile PMC638.10]
MKNFYLLTCSICYLLISELLVNKPVLSQSSPTSNNSNSQVTGEYNNIFQTPNQNSNVNEFNFPNIYPLNHSIDTPVNTENDFGFNISAGVKYS